MTPGATGGIRYTIKLRAPKAAIQKLVSPTSGFLASCGPLTPGFTGGHNCNAPTELDLQFNLQPWAGELTSLR